MTSRVRGISRKVRFAAHRLLRPVRRAKIARTLARLPGSPSCLVVCLGNVCRSPYAAQRLREAFRARGRSDIRVESAGLVQPGRPSPANARVAARRRGVDLDEHTSRSVGTELLERADVVFVMSVRQQKELRSRFGHGTRIVLLGDADPRQPWSRSIRDPFERSLGVYAAVYSRLDRCCEAIADWMSAAPASPRAGTKAEEAGGPANLRGKQPQETVDRARRSDDGRPKAAAG